MFFGEFEDLRPPLQPSSEITPDPSHTLFVDLERKEARGIEITRGVYPLEKSDDP